MPATYSQRCRLEPVSWKMSCAFQTLCPLFLVVLLDLSYWIYQPTQRQNICNYNYNMVNLWIRLGKDHIMVKNKTKKATNNCYEALTLVSTWKSDMLHIHPPPCPVYLSVSLYKELSTSCIGTASCTAQQNRPIWGNILRLPGMVYTIDTGFIKSYYWIIFPLLYFVFPLTLCVHIV